MAVGVRPNTELVAEAGCKVNRGILVDDKVRDDPAGYLQRGRLRRIHDIAAGMARILAILPNAYMQGECAGINMAGDTSCSPSNPDECHRLMGLHMITAGSYDGDAYLENDGEHYKLLVPRTAY